jgi:nucleotide-binding universal stress UspA family protein
MVESSSPHAYAKILVAFDGSSGAVAALRRALFIAKSGGAAVTALLVDESPPQYAKGFGRVDELEEIRETQMAEIRAQVGDLAASQGVAVAVDSVEGHAAQSIVTYAKENGFDLIVIGHTGQSGIWGTLMGSTTSRVADQAQCDVLVAR